MSAYHDALCLRMLTAIDTLQRQHGYPPTLVEAGSVIGVTSTGHLAQLRASLVARGWLTVHPRHARSMLLTSEGRAALTTAQEAHDDDIATA